MKRYLVLFAAALLAACNNQAVLPVNADPVTQAQARATAQASVDNLALLRFNAPTSLGALAVSQPALLPLQVLGIPATDIAQCSTRVSPDTLVDADKDGIPKEATFSYDCTFSIGQIAYETKGSVRLEDTKEDAKNSGFKVTYSDFRNKFSGLNQAFEQTLNGSYLLDTQSANLFKVEQAYANTFSRTKNSVTGANKVNFDSKLSYTPDSAAQPEQAGTFRALDAQVGQLVVEESNKRLSWVLSIGAEGLHYNSSCSGVNAQGERAPKIDRGSVTYEYNYTNGTQNAKSVLRIQFTGCGTFSATLDGVAL
jgi:hypothetical protein